MKKNHYTFPVTEVDSDITNKFGIRSYPTKILVTPSGKYIEIPHVKNWKEYVNNYVLQ